MNCTYTVKTLHSLDKLGILVNNLLLLAILAVGGGSTK